MVVQQRLQIHKEALSFSAGHFTIFSASERETMHGHNYYVSASFDLLISENGLSFDYRFYKKKLQTICDKLDRHFLLPQYSPYLRLESDADYYYAYFNNIKIQ